jgi:hypothetical protein
MHGVGLLKMHQRLYALFILYERQQLLHSCPSLLIREGQELAELGSTGPIRCSCPGAGRMSVVPPNSDVETDSK